MKNPISSPKPIGNDDSPIHSPGAHQSRRWAAGCARRPSPPRSDPKARRGPGERRASCGWSNRWCRTWSRTWERARTSTWTQPHPAIPTPSLSAIEIWGERRENPREEHGSKGERGDLGFIPPPRPSLEKPTAQVLYFPLGGVKEISAPPH